MASINALSRLQSPAKPSADNDLARKVDVETFIWKTATVSVTSNTTLQNDADLLGALVANAKYAFQGFIIYDGASAGDFKTAFTVPSGATLNWTAFGPASGIGVNSLNAFGANASGGALSLACNGAGNMMGATPHGFVSTSGTAGNLQFQWAQVASSGTSTRVWLGSWLSLVRLT